MEIIYRVVLNGQVYEGVFSMDNEIQQGELTVRRSSVDLGAARIELTQRKDTARGGEILEPTLVSLSDSVCTVRDFMVGYSGLSVSRMHYFTSDWGSEFSPVEEDFANCEEKILQINSGRSCKQLDPWAGLTLADGAMSVAVGHGGNWRMEISKAKGSVLAGLHGEIFEKELAPGASFAGIRVAMACCVDMDEACRALRDFIYHHVSRIGQEHWTEAPVVYNPWWPYEDRFINEDVCRRNADAARELGVTQFMLDAGWFGDEQDTGAHMDWFEKRGDWKNVNRQRFPHGMAALCKDVNARGLKFGMWCEIEAIGQQAQIRFEHPEYAACRGDEFLGYACMASPEVRAWAKSVLVQLIEEYGARWIKFDFNLDPGLGCDRPGHGHGKDDGLFEHYRGYYQLLDEIHAQYPDVVLENCSSVGLRLDFETLSHTYFTHLSDPDYVEHHFQVFWGATSYLPAACCYHFTQSQMRNPLDNDREPEPISADMPRHRFDYIIRACMVCNLGLSYRLDELPDWCAQRLKQLIAFYRGIAIPYVYEGELFRLTGQPIRGGKGERWQAYEYLAGDGSAVCMVFRLKQSEDSRIIRLQGLEPDRRYAVRFEDAAGRSCEMTGRALMEQGIAFDALPAEASEILRVIPM